ncbi:MAG: SPOR domain-containing protein [Alphaproteobacteria bacterium]
MVNGKDPIETELDRLDAEDGGNAGPGNLRRFLPATLAIVTVAGFAGVVWYAYSTGIREGSEFAAPLLEAAGPSKIAPQDPGGREIPDQDKQVYGAIDRSDNVAKVERLLPPPENPLPVPVAPAPVAPPPVADPQLDVPETPPVLASPPPPPSITGPLESPGSADAPPNPADTATLPEPAPQSLVPPKPAEPPAPVPAPRPAVEEKPAPVAVPEPVAPPRPEPVAAPPVADNFRIQLASLRTADAAKIAWEKRAKEAGPLLADVTLFVAEVEIPGKGTFFRAQGGPFADKESAQKVCEALKEKKIGCFVVKR